MKRVFRILWTLHLSFDEGFERATMERILKQYPPNLLEDLAETSRKAVVAVAEGFPTTHPAVTVEPSLPRDDLLR